MLKLDSDLSEQIRVIRVICIFFMMYVHVNPGITGEETSFELAAVRWLLGDILGRASVPTLSIISGILMSFELQRKPYFAAIRHRMVSIVLPMMTWNVLFILTGLAIYQILGAETAAYRAIRGQNPIELVIFKILALSGNGATDALNFLRDIFVCALLSPFLINAIRKFGIGFLTGVWVAGILLGFEPVVQRPTILMFYCLGIYLAFNIEQIMVYKRFVAIALAALLTVTALKHPGLWGSTGAIPLELMVIAQRLCLSVLIFYLSQVIIRTAKVRGLLLGIENRIFLIFLSHNLVFMLAWGAWQIPFGNSLNFPYIIFYVSLPLIWLWASQYFALAIMRGPKWARHMLAGK